MDLDTYIVTVFGLIDDALPHLTSEPRLRQRGPQPVLHDSEVLTMEVVGEFLGLDQDIAIYRYFRRAHPGWFPALLDIHRTTFTRQAANLWVLKERLWRVLLDRVAYDPSLSIVDSVPDVVRSADIPGRDATADRNRRGRRWPRTTAWRGPGQAPDRRWRRTSRASDRREVKIVPEAPAGLLFGNCRFDYFHQAEARLLRLYLQLLEPLARAP